MTDQYRIGVIGGSGLYGMEGLTIEDERRIPSPWGDPSDAYLLGTLDGQKLAFLPRHGRGHRLLPSELNYRANIYGFKTLGVERVISVSAVGSMQLEYKPTHIVVPDQFFDRTRHRPDTFFGDGIVAHVSFARPVCPELVPVFAESARAAGATAHAGGCYLCMEGPLFSTRAESHLYRSCGAGLINMSALPEAKLAREAELCYALVCMVTDYDCWREGESDVDIQMVIRNLTENAERARALLPEIVPKAAAATRWCGCANACQFAIITAREHQPKATRTRLRAVLPRYFDA